MDVLDNHENYEKVKQLFNHEDECYLTNAEDEKQIINFVLYKAEEEYNQERYYRQYETFEDFLCSPEVDAIVFYVTQGEYDIP